ncbi:agmatine deiminase family protein [Actinomadura luteofluorescens]|uniref:agmatine deiminase family protein n=1 Tax=Actinomadura TaxID=1988 RepID=UPI0033DBBEFF
MNLNLSRRQALQATAVALTNGALSACKIKQSDHPDEGRTAPAVVGPESLRMPAESHPHQHTFMAWPTRQVWKSHIVEVREDIARIARAIAEFEPVVLLANHRDAKSARHSCGSRIDVVSIPVDDLWVRDTGPSFVLGPGGIAGIDLNFNGWGDKQFHDHDRQVARKILTGERIKRIQAPITGEGGAIEVDGQGTLVATESSLVNANRNPGRSRKDIEAALKTTLGVTTVLWVDGVKGHDITDYHIDALARFTEPGVLVMSTPNEDAPWAKIYDQARSVLGQALDARGKRLDIVELPEPVDIGARGEGFLSSYVNYYVVNDGVVMPRFGDRKADANAASIVRDLYPGRKVVQLPVDALAEGGGGIHCATQQMPRRI